MGFFAGLFNKTDKVKSLPENSDKYSQEEIKKLYGQLFNQFSGDLNSFQFQTEINHVLLSKRERVASSEEYIFTLISNVTYFIESHKAIMNIIKGVFSAKILPDSIGLEEKVYHAQNAVKQKMPVLIEENKVIYNKKYQTNNQRIEALQFDYAYHSLINNWTIDMIGVLSNNPEFINKLFAESADLNIETFKMYLQLHANAKLENIDFRAHL